ncbi:bifunctional riboflavin kinase/FAD synthetase [Flavobacterium sp. GT3R68]|uniref:bifunctional riboflavin kinase/FAD synthetase n=1 Tax=Flavobacterium sp. GT3R68 TaxID=2594437 RepID=UPI000F88281B|nr:bifunctional riboflavin kinase/FAD synthetase [Flavobacterium sp. GT3R68]RTY90878.1 bifunctional riboflavin kinase/FAD synthetase [Flavobacterium sp. GSN2]TRW93870.1 bifunctional riboflavin kinase/FAD synthetase [Flavobacterium sp. GT3R68]
MKVFNSISEFACPKKTVVTLGTFDGVHLGHQKIIDRLLNSASNNNLESVVLTFSQHPRAVLHVDSNIKLLNSNLEKSALLEKKGIDNLIIHPFDAQFSELTGEEFVRTVLVEKLNIQKIIIGYDHRFGKNRNSNIDDLIVYGKQYDFEVEQISAKEINDVSISSTKIRNAITEGEITLANKYLGYYYFLSGPIIKGKQLGKTIGFPTANIKIEEASKLIPKNGVYVVKSILNNREIFGMMNIGTNPTVDGKNLSIEVHFFDFNNDLYNQKITVSILKRLRSEQKFDSVGLLQAQLEKDRSASLSYLADL